MVAPRTRTGLIREIAKQRDAKKWKELEMKRYESHIKYYSSYRLMCFFTSHHEGKAGSGCSEVRVIAWRDVTKQFFFEILATHSQLIGMRYTPFIDSLSATNSN